ncbi:hypothetical protein D3C80_1616540 [compost metagenome]
MQCAETEVAGNAFHSMGNAFGRRAIAGAKRGRELLPRESLALGELTQQFDVEPAIARHTSQSVGAIESCDHR